MRILIVLVALSGSLPGIGSAEAEPNFGRTESWARVPEPGAPEGIAIDGDRVYVGTLAPASGNAGGVPSKLFTFDKNDPEAPPRSQEIQGQDLGVDHGISGIAVDADGLVYLADKAPARILRVEAEAQTQETYASFPDLVPCHSAPAPCSPTLSDRPPYPNDLAFDAAGNLYVTDIFQATIYRVRPGGAVDIWFQDERLDVVYGPNGLRVHPTAPELYFAVSGGPRRDIEGTPTFSQETIFRLPLTNGPSAEDLDLVYRWLVPFSSPDGIAIGSTGMLYAALNPMNAIAAVDPTTGSLVTQGPSLLENLQASAPLDGPANIAFDQGGWALVTNVTFFSGNASNWAVVRVYLGDDGAPLHRPAISV